MLAITWSVRNKLHRMRFVALLSAAPQGRMQIMKRRIFTPNRKVSLAFGMLLLLDATRTLMGEPTAAAVTAFNAYSAAVESRLVQQHKSQNGFLAPYGAVAMTVDERLRKGETIIDRV